MRRLIHDRSTPLVCLITDRQLLPNQTKGAGLTFLIEFIDHAMAAGVDIVQIRRRELSARNAFHLTDAVATLARSRGTCLLVNERADIAACAGAGVHLTTRSMPASVVREAFGKEIVIGVSTHSLDEAQAAERGGADLIVFGPVFETPSKKGYGSPVGLEALRRAASCLSIPVLALGGIKLSNYRDTLDAGAAGVAGISMFTETHDLEELVATIKAGVR